ncbi:MAG: right-handed parallel beta-helix repeat-containing protein, partial [FCB group bacterium]
MKKYLFIIPLILSLIMTNAFSQTEVPLTDNMTPDSNSYIKIIPGNYTLNDAGRDGLIQIRYKANITIDGDSVNVSGMNYSGYMIEILNSQNITIKNFKSVKNFFYAVEAFNSSNINIQNCNFTGNKVDSIGWISIWTDVDQALGGGILLDSCTGGRIIQNTSQYSNDGIALYHCDSVIISENNFSWNTSYGIRMYFSNNCLIYKDTCSNVNRPRTDPSDCAAILMLVSNNNTILNNDFTNSGDGVFLGQYQYSNIPNNNYFEFNDCSGSPHNAIEATFAGGNIFKHNICNTSQYGFWLGYSFNNVVDSNEVNYNQVAGISVDWGYNNLIFNNDFAGNPTGIQLTANGNPAKGYESNQSKDYKILNNIFKENTRAISSSNTEHVYLSENNFIRNWNDIDFADTIKSEKDTIYNNTFDRTVMYFIENNSPKTIHAENNSFTPDSEDYIFCKIYDSSAYNALGPVIWSPRKPGESPIVEYNPPSDLTEPETEWSVYTEECGWHGLAIPTKVEFDSTDRKVGKASIKVTTGNGWYVWVHYRPAGGKFAYWDLSKIQTMSFWVKGIDTNQSAFQYHQIRLGNDCGGYYKYEASAAVLNTALGRWKNYIVPLKGNSVWTRSAEGKSDVYMSEISYVEIYADTYGVGFELWLDGFTF